MEMDFGMAEFGQIYLGFQNIRRFLFSFYPNCRKSNTLVFLFLFFSFSYSIPLHARSAIIEDEYRALMLSKDQAILGEELDTLYRKKELYGSPQLSYLKLFSDFGNSEEIDLKLLGVLTGSSFGDFGPKARTMITFLAYQSQMPKSELTSLSKRYFDMAVSSKTIDEDWFGSATLTVVTSRLKKDSGSGVQDFSNANEKIRAGYFLSAFSGSLISSAVLLNKSGIGSENSGHELCAIFLSQVSTGHKKCSSSEPTSKSLLAAISSRLERRQHETQLFFGRRIKSVLSVLCKDEDVDAALSPKCADKLRFAADYCLVDYGHGPEADTKLLLCDIWALSSVSKIVEGFYSANIPDLKFEPHN